MTLWGSTRSVFSISVSEVMLLSPITVPARPVEGAKIPGRRMPGGKIVDLQHLDRVSELHSIGLWSSLRSSSILGKDMASEQDGTNSEPHDHR